MFYFCFVCDFFGQKQQKQTETKKENKTCIAGLIKGGECDETAIASTRNANSTHEIVRGSKSGDISITDKVQNPGGNPLIVKIRAFSRGFP